MTSTAETTSTVHCSFCAKPSTEVEKVVAGAGVYICNECVQLCVAVLEKEQGTPSTAPRVPAWEQMTNEQILAHLPRIAAVEAQVDRSLREWVGHLRDRGVTWDAIGSALGVTRQSAWERFATRS